MPSQTTSSESSVPCNASSMTTRWPASPNAFPDSFAATSRSASSRSSVTSTPFPAASPSVLTTYGPGIERRYWRASSSLENASQRAVGTPASEAHRFMNSLDPSRRAPSAPGPKTRRPRERSRSARPSTSGASGPMTNRSASISSGGAGVDSSRWPSADRPVIPGLPGVTTTSALRASTCASACSRPPEPTTQTVAARPRLMRRSGRTAPGQDPRRRR